MRISGEIRKVRRRSRRKNNHRINNTLRKNTRRKNTRRQATYGPTYSGCARRVVVHCNTSL